jgi:poly(hydroxyalkanoate) depolymerase family esterase
MKISKLLTAVAGAAVLFVAADAFAGTTYSYTMSAKSYSGSRNRQYKVYVPTNVQNPAPMVMVLHGCLQTHNDVLSQWGMTAKADAEGFILVAPYITSYDGMRNQDCWGFWFAQHTKEGQGEPEDLHQIGLEVESNYSIDANKRYITGLSSGGAMTAIAAVTHNEYWTAAAPAAGLAYGESSSSVALSGMKPTFQAISTTASNIKREMNDDYKIPLMVMQNNNDQVVQQPAGRNIRDAHLQAHGASGFQTINATKASETACAAYWSSNYNCKHTKYTVDGTPTGATLVETIFFDGPDNGQKGHYWIGGTNGNYAAASGPKYPDITWEFFNRHSRGGVTSSPIGVPQITLAGSNPQLVEMYDTFVDPGATATDLEDGTLTVTADCNVDTSVAGEYSCTYVATDSEDNTAVSVRVVRVWDPTPPPASCDEIAASPSAHIAAGRAVKGGNFDLYAMVKDVQIGNSFDTWSSVTLYEGEAGDWYTQQPAVCHGGETPVEPEPEPEPPAFTCQQFYATAYSHQVAGRAVYQSMYYKAVGSLENISMTSGTYAYLREVSEGYYEVGQCP